MTDDEGVAPPPTDPGQLVETGADGTIGTHSIPAGSRLSAQWVTTAAHSRAVVVGLLLVAVGVLIRRPDAVALGTPLVIVAVWSQVRRPADPPVAHAWLRHPVLREGQTTAWSLAVEPGPGVEEVGLTVTESEFTRFTPTTQSAVSGEVRGATGLLDVFCQSTRWGLRRIGPAHCAVSSAFGAHSWSPPPIQAEPVPTIPLPEAFSARTSAPNPDGLVGANHSRHHGDGSELADVRGFRFGDRLRRIHWPVSVRTGELHVATTYSDEDSELLILVDAMQDLGRSTGFDGEASSLDNGVRAAAAVAEHYLRTGDRVGLQVLGAQASPRLTPGLGSNQLRRILEVLARARVADGGVVDDKRLRGQLLHPVSAGTLTLLLTPAVSVDVLAHAAQLSRRGIPAVVVDTLPRSMMRTELTDDELAGLVPEQDAITPGARLAWRIRLLERSREMSRVRLGGVPIVPWVGPGTLDLVLRDLNRVRRSPRMVGR